MSFWNKVAKGFAKGVPGAILGLGTDMIFGGMGNTARAKEADRAFERSKEMFDYQNRYNTPARQMQRLRDAGLNPALMYGQGTTGNAQGFPQQQPARMENVAGANSLNTALLKAQIDEINARTKNLNADSDNKETQGDLLSYEAAIKKIEADGNQEHADTIKRAIQADAQNRITDKELNQIDLNLRRAGFHDKYLPTILSGIFGFNPEEMDKNISGEIKIGELTLSEGITQRQAIIAGIAAWRLGEITLKGIFDLRRAIMGKPKNSTTTTTSKRTDGGGWIQKRETKLD